MLPENVRIGMTVMLQDLMPADIARGLRNGNLCTVSSMQSNTVTVDNLEGFYPGIFYSQIAEVPAND